MLAFCVTFLFAPRLKVEQELVRYSLLHQIETFLDFDPVFLDTAKDMLREFIDRTESKRR